MRALKLTTKPYIIVAVFNKCTYCCYYSPNALQIAC